MVALGLADPERIVRNSTAPPEAHLFLTKPLGVGIATTAHKRGIAEPELLRSAVELMTTPNDAAAEAMVEVGAEAATDVTGFGLLGHLQRMLAASGVGARIDASAVPVLPGILDLAMLDVVPGGTKRNHAYLRSTVQWGRLSLPEQLVLADAQTSGGLLIAALDHEWMAGELTGRGHRLGGHRRDGRGAAGDDRRHGPARARRVGTLNRGSGNTTPLIGF